MTVIVGLATCFQQDLNSHESTRAFEKIQKILTTNEIFQQALEEQPPDENTKNRKKQMNPHTAGKKSFALVRNKLEKEKETVSAKEIFVFTRTRKLGHLYKTSTKTQLVKFRYGS
uniref:Uncharacterized protein n=1 Tax=Solanum lycopersicum TaxID=4081 RepID=A0A3Q7FL75_SOLLC